VETASRVRALGRLADDEESPDFEPEHLNVLARLLDAEGIDLKVYGELRDEVRQRQL
jgi:hypothetical protein